MATFKEMTQDGTIKRADRHQLRLEDLHVEPGFNPEGRLDDDAEENISLLAFIRAGGKDKLPPLEVRPRAEGGAWIVEGHRRHKFIGIADQTGTPLRDRDGNLWIDVKQFQGNDIDRHVRVITSQSNMKLTPLQLGLRYAILRGFSKSPEEIADMVNRSRQHVDQMLILADANHDVQAAVKAGDISATEAVKLQRQHGDNTGSVIKQVQGDAPGKKVTAKALKPWTPPAKYTAPVVDAAQELVKALPKDVRAWLSGSAELPETETVEVSAAWMRTMLQDVTAIKEAEKQAKAKAKAKADKEAQLSIPGAEAA